MELKELFDKTKTKIKLKKLNGMDTAKESDMLVRLSAHAAGEAFNYTPEMELSRDNAIKNMEDYTGKLDKNDLKSVMILHDYLLMKYNDVCKSGNIRLIKYLLNDIEVASMRLNTICNNVIPQKLHYEDNLDELADSLRVSPENAFGDWKSEEKGALLLLRESYEKRDLKNISKASFMLMFLTLEASSIKTV